MALMRLQPKADKAPPSTVASGMSQVLQPARCASRDDLNRRFARFGTRALRPSFLILWATLLAFFRPFRLDTVTMALADHLLESEQATCDSKTTSKNPLWPSFFDAWLCCLQSLPVRRNLRIRKLRTPGCPIVRLMRRKQVETAWIHPHTGKSRGAACRGILFTIKRVFGCRSPLNWRRGTIGSRHWP